MRRRTFVGCASGALILGPSAIAAWMGAGDPRTDIRPALRWLDRARQQADLPRLTPERALTTMARRHGHTMALARRTSHFGPEGAPPPARALLAGFDGDILGETLAETREGPKNTVLAWLSHPETRAVLLEPRARQIGLAAVLGADSRIWWDLVIAA